MLKSNTNPKLLFILTGSIALYKVMNVLSHFKKLNYQIKVVATESALKFVGVSTIEGLTSEKVHVDLYANGSNMDHIHLIRWADAIIAAPATANYINKLAIGVADDLASTLFLAHDFTKPFAVFPAMNTKMYQHPSTQKSIAQLKSWGVDILESASGVLACGEIGIGRLLEPEQMITAIENLQLPTHVTKPTAAPFTKAKNILISSGGTQEPIDDIRVITNKSSGKTAASIADQFIANGFAVTYLAAETAKLPTLECEVVTYRSFQSLEKKLRELLPKEYATFIHAAAVSDYSVIPTEGKINSDSEELTIKLKRNPKLIDLVKKLSPSTKLVGFKLTSTTDEKLVSDKITKLFENSKCDIVIHNDWLAVSSDKHVFNMHSKTNAVKTNLTLDDLAQELITEEL
ncbi:MAG: bifunctional phosphopantothenoylcysteine decarboxylase/phosphopantothenate--cysteine ligase CoaBC [Bdellovibrionota bacterium]